MDLTVSLYMILRANLKRRAYPFYRSKSIVSQLNATMSNRSMAVDGELTSVKISHDSRYALVNHAPDVRTFSDS